MPRQKTRTGSDGSIDPALAETKKARHRLVGAIALCLLAAILVPMLLESEPRSGARDLPITIETAFESTRPDRPWIEPPPMEEPGGYAPSDRIAGLADEADMDPAYRDDPPSLAPAPVMPVQPRSQTEPAPAPAAPRPQQRQQPPAAGTPSAPQAPAPKPARPAKPATDDPPDVLSRLIDEVEGPRGNRAGSAGNAAKPPTPRVTRRFIVQVGAYSSAQSARQVAERITRAGLTPYQETVKAEKGNWVRVRVGPFSSREEAEQAQQKLARAGIKAALIAL